MKSDVFDSVTIRGRNCQGDLLHLSWDDGQICVYTTFHACFRVELGFNTFKDGLDEVRAIENLICFDVELLASTQESCVYDHSHIGEIRMEVTFRVVMGIAIWVKTIPIDASEGKFSRK